MSLSVQFLTTLAMIAMGIEIGAALDTYKRFINRRKSILLFLNDFLFWVCQGLLVFLALIEVNEGELRFFIFIALLCGFAAYQSLFKKMYLSLLEWIIRVVLKTYHVTKRIIEVLVVKPIIWLLQLTFALCMMLGKVIYKVFSVIGLFFYRIIRWLLYIIYSMLPKRIKKFIKLGAGYFNTYKNIVKKWILKWRK
jgi:spore cortex biosynthesis protein YabQ